MQNKNFFEVEKIYELCSDIGFDKLTFQLHLTDWGKLEWREKNNKEQINNEDTNAIDILKKKLKIEVKKVIQK